jgi:hypothetical protein
MATGDEGSVTRWLDEFKAGDPAAAQRLWARYFARLRKRAPARHGHGVTCVGSVRSFHGPSNWTTQNAPARILLADTASGDGFCYYHGKRSVPRTPELSVSGAGTDSMSQVAGPAN